MTNIQALKKVIQEAQPNKDWSKPSTAVDTQYYLADILFAIKNKQDIEEDKDLKIYQVDNLGIMLNLWNLKENFDNQAPEVFEFLEKILI